MSHDTGTESADRRSASRFLTCRQPYQVEPLFRFLAARAIPGVETVDAFEYRRSLRIGTGYAVVALAWRGGSFELQVQSTEDLSLSAVENQARDFLDLDCDPDVVDQSLLRSTALRPLVEARPGLRVPGAFDGFELGVRAILGQQVSVAAATTTSGRLVALLGDPIETHDQRISYLFPTAETLSAADVSDLGVPESRRDTISAFAAAVSSGAARLDGSADHTETRRALLAVPGIGPWTAEYIAMRALRDPDAFPATDLGLIKATRALAGAETPGDLAEQWRPWRSYAAMHLWESLAD